MTNDDILTEVIQLIKAGKKDAARAVLEPFLRQNPNHIRAWMWEAELFPNDREKIKVLETCLKFNPGNLQVIEALTFLKKRAESNQPPATSAVTSTTTSAPSPVKPVQSAPFVSSPPFLPESNMPVAAPRQPAKDIPAAVIPRQPRPLPQNNEASAKISNGRKRLTRNLIIAVTVFVLIVVVIGAYLGGGFYLNGQIINSFSANNCTNVVQYDSLVSFYPRLIFSSMFTGYDRYFECRIKLDMDQAVAVKNWADALSQTHEYLEAYPNGIFAASMREQSPDLYASWSDDLIANHDYGNGIERLKQLVELYPDSQPARSASDVILQTYVSWTKNLTGKQDYQAAEQILNSASSYFRADTVRSDQVIQMLVDMYVEWGNAQVLLGDTANGIKHYQKAGEIAPGKVDVDLLIARVNLQKAVDTVKAGYFDSALAKVKEISDGTQSDSIKSEANAARDQILTAYSVSTSQQAVDQMNAAISLTCQGQRPELPIFGLNVEKTRFGTANFGISLPVDWVAQTPSELHYVICVNETSEELQSCVYQGNHFLVRMRYVWNIVIYGILNGDKLASETFDGSAPPKCQPQEYFQSNISIKQSFGNKPSMDEIMAWLSNLNFVK